MPAPSAICPGSKTSEWRLTLATVALGLGIAAWAIHANHPTVAGVALLANAAKIVGYQLSRAIAKFLPAMIDAIFARLFTHHSGAAMTTDTLPTATPATSAPTESPILRFANAVALKVESDPTEQAQLAVAVVALLGYVRFKGLSWLKKSTLGAKYPTEIGMVTDLANRL